MTLRDQINALQDRRSEEVELANGITVRVMEMSAQAAIEMSGLDGTDQQRAQAMLANCIVDDDNLPIYDRETIAELYAKSMDTVRVLVEAARRVNGFEDGDVKKD